MYLLNKKHQKLLKRKRKIRKKLNIFLILISVSRILKDFVVTVLIAVVKLIFENKNSHHLSVIIGGYGQC